MSISARLRPVLQFCNFGGKSLEFGLGSASINAAYVTRKNVYVEGDNFDTGAVIVLNSEHQPTRNDNQNLQTTLKKDYNSAEREATGTQHKRGTDAGTHFYETVSGLKATDR